MNWKDLIESQKDMNKNKKFQEYLALKKQDDTAAYREQNFRLLQRGAGRAYSQNQEYADISGANLYRVEFNGQWSNVWAMNEQDARIYVYDNFCHFGVCMVTKTKLLVKSNKTEMEID